MTPDKINTMIPEIHEMKKQSVGGEYGLTSIPTEQGGGVTCRRTI